MDATLLHTILELACVVFYGAIAYFSYKRLVRTRDKFNLFWIGGFGISAAIVAIHALVGQFDLSSHGIWIPATWAAERAVILLMLYASMIMGYLRKFGTVIVVSVLAIGLSVLTSVPELGVHMGGVVQDILPYRPIDFTLAVLWAGLWLIFVVNRKTLIEHNLPPFFHWFIFLGIVVHTIMVFSPVPFDVLFELAHVVKLVEAGIWATAFYLWEKRATR